MRSFTLIIVFSLLTNSEYFKHSLEKIDIIYDFYAII